MVRAVHAFCWGFFACVPGVDTKKLLREGAKSRVRRAGKQTGGLGIVRGKWAALSLLLCCAFSPANLQCQTTPDTGQVEAVYLRKILEFVQWPSGQASLNENFHLCVAGRYALSFTLAQEMRDARVAGRKIEVQIIRKQQDLNGCQVLFISTPDTKLRARILHAVKGAQILTVGDDSGFLEAGGILRFCNQGSVVQFDVNLPAARAAGLQMDGRLLSMAHRVITEYGAADI